MKTFLYIKPKNNITALGLNAAFFDLLNEHNHITSFLALIHSDIKLDVSKVLFNKILVTKVSIFSPRFLDKDYVKSGDIKEWLSGVGLNNIQINIAYEIINTIFSDKFTDYEICIKSWIDGGKTNQFWINPQNIVAISEPDSVSIKVYNSYIRDLNSHLKNKDNNLLSENDIDEMIKDADDYLNDGDQNDDLDDEDSLGDDPRYP